MSSMQEDFKYIQDMGRVMASQDNRATQYPLYAVMEDRRNFVEPGQDYDERERKEDTNEWDLCKSCSALFEDDKELPADCSDCDPDAFDHWKLEDHLAIEMAGVFFTEMGCQTHIDTNKHHYNNPRVYGIGAWRNYEMQAVMRQVIRAGEVEVPSHYV